jgi:non-homologous end joining protein Ku
MRAAYSAVSGGTSKLFIDPVLLQEEQGREITVAVPEARAHGQIIDLMQALKQSIEKAKPTQKAAPAQRKRKTASSDS